MAFPWLSLVVCLLVIAQVLELIARGAFGNVLKVRQLESRKVYAMKVRAYYWLLMPHEFRSARVYITVLTIGYWCHKSLYKVINHLVDDTITYNVCESSTSASFPTVMWGSMFLIGRLQLAKSCASSPHSSFSDKLFLMLSNHLRLGLPLVLSPAPPSPSLSCPRILLLFNWYISIPLQPTFLHFLGYMWITWSFHGIVDLFMIYFSSDTISCWYSAHAFTKP